MQSYYTSKASKALNEWLRGNQLSIGTKVSSISHDYVTEVFAHTVTGDSEGIPTFSTYSKGAMHGSTPLISTIRALETSHIHPDWSPFVVELLAEIEALLPTLGRIEALSIEIDELIGAIEHYGA